MKHLPPLFAIGLLSAWPVIGTAAHAASVAHLEVTRGAVNYEGRHHVMLDRLLAQDGLIRMGRFQAIGEVVPSISDRCETYSIFTSGFNAVEPPSATISGSTITVDLSSLFFAASRGNTHSLWNIGDVVTGLYNPESKQYVLAWDRVFDGGGSTKQASFFLSGLVHFDVEPVPIPAAVWLFGSGIAGIAALARRRNSL